MKQFMLAEKKYNKMVFPLINNRQSTYEHVENKVNTIYSLNIFYAIRYSILWNLYMSSVPDLGLCKLYSKGPFSKSHDLDRLRFEIVP